MTAPLLEGMQSVARPQRQDVVLDAGCGEGFYLGSLAGSVGCSAHGVDIAIAAADAAAKRYRECEWIVANADRRIPFANRSFSLVLSITGRLNAPEFLRVLRPDGRLLVAVPAPDDLIEIRGRRRDRVERTIAEAEKFRLVQQKRVTTTADLEAEVVDDILHSIYRPLRKGPTRAMRLTFSLDLLLFGRLEAAG